ncbi:MAG: DUF6648 family protein [Lachnospiraceae bacterium]|nr:DUF6648 family protein [Lachnospiraceae bacterium]
MNKIEKYFKTRQNLINQYLKGDLTKKEFLIKNYNAVIYSDIGPFENMDSVLKGLFNYQFYNALAKESKALSSRESLDRDVKNSYLSEANYYYRKKDDATLSILKKLDFKGVSAYHVKVRSKYLKNKLIEIIIEDYNMILHTTNPFIESKLREENVLDEKRHSVIDGYVNQKY